MNISQLCLGLLAYTLALYSLAGKEQRSPYVSSAAYGTTLCVLIGGVLGFAATAIVPDGWFFTQFWVEEVAQLAVAIGIVKLAHTTVYLRNRRVNFRDDHVASNFRVYRRWKGFVKRVLHKSTYEQNPEPWPQELEDALAALNVPDLRDALACLKDPSRKDVARRAPTITITIESPRAAATTELLLPLASAFVQNDCLVQYLACSRHPVHFVASLRESLQERLSVKQRSRLITAIDAYTPHFGFTDSVYEEVGGLFKTWGIKVIPSGPSYAGMHSASARAFNHAKKTNARNNPSAFRRPTLVVYEGARAVVDLESEEQYRVFVRHVMPSEQLWGGMLTVFVETGLTDADRAVLRTYSDLYIAIPSDSSKTALKQRQ